MSEDSFDIKDKGVIRENVEYAPNSPEEASSATQTLVTSEVQASRPPGKIRMFFSKIGGFFREEDPKPYTVDQLFFVTMGGGTDKSHWSGVPAGEMGIPASQLVQFYDRIKARMGDEKAMAYVRMITEMPSLAPNHIIDKMRDLEASNWTYNPDEEEEELKENPVDFGTNRGDALAGVMIGSEFGKGLADKTPEVKAKFIDILTKERKVSLPQPSTAKE